MTEKDEALLPCPFCGGDAWVKHKQYAVPHWWAGCDSCNFQIWPKDSRNEMITAWNTRTPSPSQGSEADILHKRIAFTCERTGKRWEFNGLSELIIAFLEAKQGLSL